MSEGNHKAATTLTDVDIVVLSVKIKVLSRKLRFLLCRLVGAFDQSLRCVRGRLSFSLKRVRCHGQRSCVPALEGYGFFQTDFQPHNYCYRWNSGLVWLNVVSDTLIALAYFTIPFSLLWFIRKRRDLRFHWIYVQGFSPGPRLVW